MWVANYTQLSDLDKEEAGQTGEDVLSGVMINGEAVNLISYWQKRKELLFWGKCCTFIPNNTEQGGPFYQAIQKLCSLRKKLKNNYVRFNNMFSGGR